jgi:hypothetical protein
MVIQQKLQGEVHFGMYPTSVPLFCTKLKLDSSTFSKPVCRTPVLRNLLDSRHTKYCRTVMAANQPHFAYCGGGGGDGLWH